jgi:TonB family protein
LAAGDEVARVAVANSDGGGDKGRISMPKTARNLESAAPDAVERPAAPFKKQRFTVFLVTGDDTLWPLVGADLSGDLILKQLDSVDELLANVPAGQAGILLWDARGNADSASVLSKLSLHSTRFALIVLDAAANAGVWTLPLQHRQIVANVALPLSNVVLGKALESAREELGARLALLGDGSNTPAPPAKSEKKNLWLPITIAAVVVAGAAAFLLTRGGGAPDKSAAAVNAQGTPAQGIPGAKPAVSGSAELPNGAPAPAKAPEAADERVDGLIEKAQQAMLERHFIDPAAGSALTLYRDVLLIDPSNGEARQGLQRLAEILIARVQSALDERKFDVALQSLETARSIDANDRRLAALDDRIATLRAELGPAQITAALNAQNFDRATQLIDEATRAKSLPPAKLAQLRDDVRKRRDEFEMARLLKLVDTRLQQGKLVDPRNDSAAAYLEQAKQAGASPATLQPQYQELQRQLALTVRGAIDSKHFGDAEHWLAELHDLGASTLITAALQKDLTAARGAAAPAKPEQPQFLDLAQSRLAQGRLLEPDNDNALYYLNQLRGTDPRNSALPQLSGAVQEQILERARTALDAGDMAKADGMLQLARGLGPSPDLEAFSDRLRQKVAAASGPPSVPEQSLTPLNKLEVVYPDRALEKSLEGWVQIGFTINPDGTVGNVKVLNAAPVHMFEQAGIKAVSKLRYQPVMQGGKPVAVNTQLRVVFRMPK